MSSSIIPTIRYQDSRTALDWLCAAFGFERHLVVDGIDGSVEHAQLTLGSGMVMIGRVGDGEFDQLVTTVQKAGGKPTSTPYVIVDDVDAHHRRAQAAGAVVVMPPADQDYGGRLYSCRDPEGNLWSFGSYNPWQQSDS